MKLDDFCFALLDSRIPAEEVATFKVCTFLKRRPKKNHLVMNTYKVTDGQHVYFLTPAELGLNVSFSAQNESMGLWIFSLLIYAQLIRIVR